MVLAEQILEIELVVIQISRKNSGFGFQKSIPFTLYLSRRGGNFKCKAIDNLYPEPWALLKSCMEGEQLQASELCSKVRSSSQKSLQPHGASTLKDKEGGHHFHSRARG